MASRNEARAILLRRRKQLMKLPNVIGTGIGYKNSDPRNGWCIRVFVTTKKDVRNGKVPARLRGKSGQRVVSIATDVIKVGRCRAKAQIRQGGSIRIENRRGTCGCILKRGRNLYALTASHVAAPDVMFHPSTYGLGEGGWIKPSFQSDVYIKDGSKIATVVRCTPSTSHVDLAMALLELSATFAPQRISGFRDVLADRLKPDEPLKIWVGPTKSIGATCAGAAEDHYVRMAVEILDSKHTHEACLDVIPYNANTEAGHSGAAVTDSQDRLVGIHMAELEQAGWGLAIPANAIRRWARGALIAQ